MQLLKKRNGNLMNFISNKLIISYLLINVELHAHLICIFRLIKEILCVLALTGCHFYNY